MPFRLIALLLAFALTASTGARAAEPAPPKRPKVCLVLAGGGARGISHIGVLKVLRDMQIPIDCVVGTSMGALVGAALAGGLDPEEIENIVRTADWPVILSDSPNRADHTVYDKALERPHGVTPELGISGTELKLPRGLLVGHELQRFLRDLVPEGSDIDFDKLSIPYRAVATDFETGRQVVLRRGDLALAMRASMSVPGAFAPVTINNQLLVDGGLVDNLPVDVAREFHPDAIIAVDLGAPLLKRDELNSLFSAGLQTINILTYQNVERSRAELTDADILISPDVTDISPADFPNSFRAVERGIAAARGAADRLARFSVSADDYAAWVGAHERPSDPVKYVAVRLETGRLRHVSPAAVRARFGSDATPADVDERIDRLMGTGDFERVDVHGESTPQGDVLVIRPVEKGWGPDYLRLGIELGADLSGGSEFTISADRRATWLNSRGLEWRLHGSIGRTSAIASELRQPLDAGSDWFVSGIAGAGREQRNVYLDDNPVATYRLGELDGLIGLGRSFGTVGEIILAAGAQSYTPRYYSGIESPLFGATRATETDLRLRFTSDTIDNLDFPTRGHLIQVDSAIARPAFGSSLSFDRLQATASQAFGTSTTSVFVAARVDSSAGTTLPFYRGFGLGGFLNLSGLRQDQILAERDVFARVVVRHRLLSGGDLLPGLFIGGSLEGADIHSILNPLAPVYNLRIPDDNLKIGAGSLFLSAQSVIGPFYLALGRSRAGQTSLYLYVGRP